MCNMKSLKLGSEPVNTNVETEYDKLASLWLEIIVMSF